MAVTATTEPENDADAYTQLAACLVNDDKQAALKLLSALLRLTNGAGALIRLGAPGTVGATHRMISKQAYQWVPDLDEVIEEIVGKALCHDQILIRNLAPRINLQCLAKSIDCGSRKSTLVLLLVCEPNSISPFVSLFQTICAFELARTFDIAKTEPEPNPALHTAALLELLLNITKEPDLASASQRVVADIGEEIGADFSALSLEKSPKKLIAVARVAELDQRSAFSESAAELCELLWKFSDDSVAWSTNESHSDVELNRGFVSLSRILNVDYIESYRSTSELADSRALILLVWHDQPQTHERQRWLREAVNAVSPVIGRKPGGLKQKVSEGIRKPVGQTLFIGLLVLTTLMFLPISYNVTGDTTAQPEFRRFVAAPFDGILSNTRVRPGDAVERNGIIASMDRTSLEWEHEARMAELARAKKQKDRSLANGNRGAMNIAALEIEKLSADVELISYRLENLALSSPVKGIVLTGDLKRVEGAPVKRGDRLFEIAALDNMVFEIDIPHDDVGLVNEGDEVRVLVESLPGTHWIGQIARVHPRSIARKQNTIFKAEVHVKNEEGTLKPGMPGKAKIAVGQKALGWIIFRKPYFRVRYWLGW